MHWIEAGAPRGDGPDPLAEMDIDWPAWDGEREMGPPDLVIDIPAAEIPATGVVDYLYQHVENPLDLADSTDMVGASERVAHVAECLPEICTLDCGTMNFAEADYVMTNTPGTLQAMGRMMTELGAKPEIEAFDTGHLWYAKQLVADGILEAPARC